MFKDTSIDIVPIYYLITIFSLIIFVYFDNLNWLFTKWMTTDEYSHGPIIPLIAIYLIIQKRDVIRSIKVAGNNFGIFAILCATLLMIVSFRGQINILSSYSMILYLIGIVLFLLGKRMLYELLFPILYLLFMIPLWGGFTTKISNYLKMISSKISASIFQLAGYPVLREGVTLHFTRGSMEVADPCSGIRSIISILAIGALVAYFSKGSKLKKILLVFLGIPITVFANTLRIIFFGIMLESKGIMISEGILHTLTGIVVFVFALISLLCFDKLVKM